MDSLWQRARRTLDLRPLAILLVLYGLIQWLPFGIFGWIQNEDGLMEWASVLLLAAATWTSYRLAKHPNQPWLTRTGWTIFIVVCLIFIGEELSWGERLHGYGIEAIRNVNTQGETNLHNIKGFQLRGLLHLGWASLGLILGLGSWIYRSGPLLPDRRLCLYFLIPSIWYTGFEFCRKEGSCLITIANHQEIYEFLIALGLLLHTRLCYKQLEHLDNNLKAIR